MVIKSLILGGILFCASMYALGAPSVEFQTNQGNFTKLYLNWGNNFNIIVKML